MIASMTAFGRTEETGELGHVIWEIRSVNHRYLEVSIRLPDDLRMLETTIREHISGRIKRGKIDCNLRFEPCDSTGSNLLINNDLVQAILKTADDISSAIPELGTINPIEVLRWPGVIKRETLDPEIIGGPLLQQLDRTIDLVTEARRREGEKLQAMILQRCNEITNVVKELRVKLPRIMDNLRERLLNRSALYF